MMDQNVRQHIEITKKQCEVKVTQMKAIQELKKDKNYKIIFEKLYMDELPKHLIKDIGNARVPNDQKMLKHEQLAAIGFLVNYLEYLENEGTMALQEITKMEVEETRLEKAEAEGEL